MMPKILISPADFDNLPENEKMSYLYCEHCGKFYLSEFFEGCATCRRIV